MRKLATASDNDDLTIGLTVGEFARASGRTGACILLWIGAGKIQPLNASATSGAGNGWILPVTELRKVQAEQLLASRRKAQRAAARSRVKRRRAGLAAALAAERALIKGQVTS